MCGRYVLAMRPSQVRRHLEAQHMEVHEAPEDEGAGAPRQSYNFAPGYYGLVYRADTPDRGAGADAGAGPARQGHHVRVQEGADGAEGADEDDAADEKAAQEASKESEVVQGEDQECGGVRYKLQSMKWGLIPFWTKRNPDYGSMMRTINCRDDSLSTRGGMWATMKARKRCIVVADGFYEWLRVGAKEKVPHYIKRKDGELLLLAGLWDCVQYEDSDEKLYTYTIITTDSNQQLKFLHDRMPVVLDAGSHQLRTWLDAGRHEWSSDLQGILKPWDGDLQVYPVSKDVGKVGNNSPSFIIPVNSKENKSNIANFFANAAAKSSSATVKEKTDMDDKAAAPAMTTTARSLKRPAPSPPPPSSQSQSQSPQRKKQATQSPLAKAKLSATSNGTGSRRWPPSKDGSQKITTFFTKKPPAEQS